MSDPFADIGRLVDALQAPTVPMSARQRAAELTGALLQGHADAVWILAEAVGPDRLRELAEQPTVAAVLLLHGCHPDPPAERLAAAVDVVRRELAPGIEVDAAIVDGEVRVRLGGPGAQEPTLRTAFERAARAAVPEADVVVVSADVPVTLRRSGIGTAPTPGR